jgi:hypothetical protein
MIAEYKCPNCAEPLEERWIWKCKKCSERIAYCELCNAYSLFKAMPILGGPSIITYCTLCGNPIENSERVPKSEIYKQYRYAFKFVNRIPVPYPFYFRGQFPFGKIKEDLGVFVNDFAFVDDPKDETGDLDTDGGTARAYKVIFDIDGESKECIALSHESGLEIFLIAAGTFVGVETAKFVLKRILETIEKSINHWWQQPNGYLKTLKNMAKFRSHQQPVEYRNQEDQVIQESIQRLLEGSLIEHITVRTPHWEIAIDGRFSPEERDKLIWYIERISIPHETIEEFVADIDDKTLSRKTIEATRMIARRSLKM